LTAALRTHLAGLQAYERDELALDSWGDASRLAAQFGVSVDEVKDALRTIDSPNPRWQFVWLAGLNKAHGAGWLSVKGLKIGIALFPCANPVRPYIWPSQQTLAAKAGWSPTNRRGVFEGLRELEMDLGAIRRLRYIDLPIEVAREAERASRARSGKGKDPRSAAYVMRPVGEWNKGDQYPLGKHRYVSPEEALNSKVQHQLAAPDSFAHAQGVPSLPSPLVETSHWGTDGGRSHG
jgi:hypothetical protein